MKKTIISVKDVPSEKIVKEAKKKAIDNDVSFSEVVLILLDKWVSGNVTIDKKEVQ